MTAVPEELDDPPVVLVRSEVVEWERERGRKRIMMSVGGMVCGLECGVGCSVSCSMVRWWGGSLSFVECGMGVD